MGARDDAELMLSGEHRVTYGYLVQLEGPQGEEPVLHLYGQAREAMQDLVAEIERRGEGWQVRSISSPVTVYRDLHGSRGLGRKLTQRLNPRSYLSFDAYESERMMLKLIGREDLLPKAQSRVYLGERNRLPRQRGGRKESE